MVGYSHPVVWARPDGTIDDMHIKYDGSRSDWLDNIWKTAWKGTENNFRLVREPTNKFDPNAIQVVATKDIDDVWDGAVLGYVPGRLAKYLTPSFDRILRVVCVDCMCMGNSNTEAPMFSLRFRVHYDSKTAAAESLTSNRFKNVVI